MDADLLFIDTTPEAADMLAWATIVRDEFERHIGPSHTRPPQPDGYAPCALTGISALALRTNEAQTIADLGVDLLVGPGGNAIRESIHSLNELCPDGLTVLWDSPTWEPARRHGFRFNAPVMLPTEHAWMLAANAIRREALNHTRLLHLIGPDVKSEFAVNVLEPHWATLAAIANFAEADLLAGHGVVAKGHTILLFRAAAATAVRSFRTFPQTNTEFFNSFNLTARVLNPDAHATWHDHVLPMTHRFLAYAAERRTYLMRLPDGTRLQHAQTLAAVGDLARAIGADAVIDPSPIPDVDRGL